MTVKKKAVSPHGTGPVAAPPPPRPPTSAAFDAVVEQYAAAVAMVYKGDYARARGIFETIEAGHRHELQLAERCRTYIRICAQRLAPPLAEPEGDDECYERAVQLCNAGRPAEALPLLERCLKSQPASVRCLYVRATAWALQGNVEAAVNDLRQAIAIDPKVRFQVANDADFERVRENPNFIDLIEPTPAGT